MQGEIIVAGLVLIESCLNSHENGFFVILLESLACPLCLAEIT